MDYHTFYCSGWQQAVILSWQKASYNGNKFWISSKPRESQHNNTAAAGDETLRRQEVWVLSGIVRNISCLLSFSFLLARMIIWMKGSKIYRLRPCTLSHFDHPMAERKCTSEVSVTSREWNCAHFSCHNSISWETTIIFLLNVASLLF